MSTAKRQVSQVVNDIIHKELQSGQFPTLRRIMAVLNQRFAGKVPGLPVFHIRPAPHRGRSSSAQWNAMVDEIDTDLKTLFEEHVHQSDLLLRHFGRLHPSWHSLQEDLQNLIDRITALLLVLDSAEGYFYAIGDNFHGLSRIAMTRQMGEEIITLAGSQGSPLKESTIELFSEKVTDISGQILFSRGVDYTLDYGKGILRRLSDSAIPSGASVRVSYKAATTAWIDLASGEVSPPIAKESNVKLSLQEARTEIELVEGDGDGVSHQSLSPVERCLDDDLDTAWVHEVVRPTDEPVAVRLRIFFDRQEANRLTLDVHEPGTSLVTVRVSSDSVNWLSLGRRISSEQMVYDFPSVQLEGVEVTFYKEAHDQPPPDMYRYIVGLRNVSLFRLGWEDEGILYSVPYPVRNLHGEPSPLGQVSLRAEEDIPPGASIEYYVAVDAPFPDWQPIIPSNRPTGEEPKVVSFRQISSHIPYTNISSVNAQPVRSVHGVDFFRLLALPVPSDAIVPESISLYKGTGQWRRESYLREWPDAENHIPSLREWTHAPIERKDLEVRYINASTSLAMPQGNHANVRFFTTVNVERETSFDWTIVPQPPMGIRVYLNNRPVADGYFRRGSGSSARITGEKVDEADGNTTTFRLAGSPIRPGTLVIRFDDPFSAPIEIDEYSVDELTGLVSFNEPPSAGTVIYADYEYDHDGRLKAPLLFREGSNSIQLVVYRPQASAAPLSNNQNFTSLGKVAADPEPLLQVSEFDMYYNVPYYADDRYALSGSDIIINSQTQSQGAVYEISYRRALGSYENQSIVLKAVLKGASPQSPPPKLRSYTLMFGR